MNSLPLLASGVTQQILAHHGPFQLAPFERPRKKPLPAGHCLAGSACPPGACLGFPGILRVPPASHTCAQEGDQHVSSGRVRANVAST